MPVDAGAAKPAGTVSGGAAAVPALPLPAAYSKPPESGTRISDRYVLGQSIGRGAFGVVYECQDQISGQTVAVKRIPLQKLTADQVAGLEQEVTLLRMLDHPNVVKFVTTVKTRHHFHIVLEYLESGSLAGNMKKFGVYTPPLVSLYTRQVLTGLKYLHAQGIIHRDIKGANILTDKRGRCKLADFGVATFVKTGGAEPNASTTVVVGTPYWMAPEIIEMVGEASFACDIWSVGSTVIELLTGKPPYFDVPQMAALWRIVSDPEVPLPENIAPEIESFLRMCFVKDPAKRPSATELLQHPWIQSSLGDGAAAEPAPFKTVTPSVDRVSISEVASTASKPSSLSHTMPGRVFDSVGPTLLPSGTSEDVYASAASESESEDVRPVSKPFDPSAFLAAAYAGPTQRLPRDEMMWVMQQQSQKTNTSSSASDSKFQKKGLRASRLLLARFHENVDDHMDFRLSDASSHRDVEAFPPQDHEFLLEPVHSPSLPTVGRSLVKSSDESEDIHLKRRRLQHLLQQHSGTQPISAAVCGEMASILRQAHPTQAQAYYQLIVSHGGLSRLVRSLETDDSQHQLALLTLIQLLAQQDTDSSFIITGLVPRLAKLIETSSDPKIRDGIAGIVEAYTVSGNGPSTKALLLATGGLDVFVGLVNADERIIDRAALVGIDGIQRILNETAAPIGSSRRSSFKQAEQLLLHRDDCRSLLLHHKGNAVLIPRLCRIGARLQTAKGKAEAADLKVDALGLLAEICHIFLVFSRGNPDSKRHLLSSLSFLSTTLTQRWSAATRSVDGYLRARGSTRAENEIEDNLDTSRAIVNTLRNLSLDPIVKGQPEIAEAFGVMIMMLGSCADALTSNIVDDEAVLAYSTFVPTTQEIRNACLVFFYHLRTIEKHMEKFLSVADFLQAIETIASETAPSTMKSMAVAILCQVPETSASARFMGRRQGIVPMLVNLLEDADGYLSHRALRALTHYDELSDVALLPENLAKFVHVLNRHRIFRSRWVGAIVASLLSIARGNEQLAEALVRHGPMVSEISSLLVSSKAPQDEDFFLCLLSFLEFLPKHQVTDAVLDYNLISVCERVSRKTRESKQAAAHAKADALVGEWRGRLREDSKQVPLQRAGSKSSTKHAVAVT